MVSLGSDVGAHPVQLVDEHEPALEHVLRGDAGPASPGHQRHHLGLEVGGEPGVGKRHEVDGERAIRGRDPDGPRVDVDPGAGVSELRQEQVEMLRPGVLDADVSERRGGGDGERPGLDPVRHHRVADRPERVDPLDLHGRGPRAIDQGPHLDQHRGQVLDLRLAGGVLDHRGPGGAHRRHEEVLRGAHAREVEPYHGPVQVGRARLEVAVLVGELRPHPLQPLEVQVDVPRPDVAAAGHGHPGPTPPRQQGPEGHDRGAHLSDQLVRRFEAAGLGGVDGDGRSLPRDRGPEVLEDLGHGQAVDDPRGVLDGGGTLGQE